MDMRSTSLMHKTLLLILCVFAGCTSTNKDSSIKPWKENPHYWQYKGKPVLLLGASDNDNLFQNSNLESHLDSLRTVGGNYIRNTMSDRDPGDLKAFALSADGKYDLNKWNETYWKKFKDLLDLTSERDIIVQIEIWDRFDHSRDPWLSDPYNPVNNVTYSYTDAGLDTLYPLHPGQNVQPFFFTVPSLNNNVKLLRYQQAFVEKLLSISLQYNNVLYCIDNETSGVEEWAVYWAGFIKARSGQKEIFITEMWDNWDVKTDVHKRTLDNPERYGFIDISQNSQLPGYQNWVNQQYVFNYISNNPRPVNSTKIYGSDRGSWLERGITTEHAIQTFFRNIIGGYASSRFHRPLSGLGLSEPSINSIKTIRNVEEIVKFWDIKPDMGMLVDSEENFAYLAGNEDEVFVIYFTRPGKVKVDLSNSDSKYVIRWINILNASWEKTEEIKGGGIVELESFGDRGCIAVIVED